jgi:hypothetical protein
VNDSRVRIDDPAIDQVFTMQISKSSESILKRPLLIGGERVVMALVLAGALFALTRFAKHAARPDQELDADNIPGGGVFVRTEALRLWVPEELSELVRRDESESAAPVRGELERCLEQRRRKGLWYALTTRAYQVDGRFTDLTVVRRPYDNPQHFSELLELLASLAGEVPGDSIEDFSTLKIHVLPEELSRADPSEIIGGLLEDASIAEGRDLDLRGLHRQPGGPVP